MEKKMFPYEIIDLDEKIKKKLAIQWGDFPNVVHVGPKKWQFRSTYKAVAEELYNFEVKKDDIWIVTFPRSGTTWTQELVWLLANNLDYEKAAQIPLQQRSPFFEFTVFDGDELKEALETRTFTEEQKKYVEGLLTPAWHSLKNVHERRIIKTHLPVSLLPHNIFDSGCKIVYVARNPKDVAVSYYRFQKHCCNGYIKDFSTYWTECFEKGLVHWGPYFEHIKEGWAHRNHKNVMFLFYENMNKDLGATIKTLAQFLNKDLSQQEVDVLQSHLSIENFRKNKSVNWDAIAELNLVLSKKGCFINKGKTGSWEEMFDENLNKQANAWIKENLKDCDIHFPL